MPRSDFQIAEDLSAQYNGEIDWFDYVNRIKEVSFAVKHFDDCSEVLCEGSFNVPDWISNFKCEMIQTAFGGIESGFNDGTDEVIEILVTMLPLDRPVYIGGHSRGSAHADILASKLIRRGYKMIIVVFGSPRAGDHIFAAGLASSERRAYKNRNDPVTCVPEPLLIPYWPYIHPTPFIMLDVAPPILDTWGLLSDHHFYLYLAGIKELSNGQG